MTGKQLKSLRRYKHMAVKHIPTGVVHKGARGGNTGCGTDTKKHSDHWQNSHERITCDKNGCKN